MKPEDVPAELIAIAHKTYTGSSGEPTWAQVLAAVLPEHERQVRAKVAEEIDRAFAEEDDGSSWGGGMLRAAKIARGES